MVNCHSTKGKRRRSGPQEVAEGPLNKKFRDNDPEPCSTNSVSEIEKKDVHKRKRHRKRTKGLRELIRNKIEIALRKSSGPLTHLFTSIDDAGTPQAPYVEVIKLIGLSQEDWLKAASLSPRAAESISNIAHMFRIERSPEHKLMLKYRATDWNIEDCTLYLDNLPTGCTPEKILRIARKFGTVVEIRVPKSPSRPVSSSHGIIDVGRHLRSFAFLQFTEPEACQSMCAVEIERRVPILCYCLKVSSPPVSEGERIAREFVPFFTAEFHCYAFNHKPEQEKKNEECSSLAPLLQRLLFHIRMLSKRRHRRTYAQSVLLMKLRRQQTAIIKMERTANKRTSKISHMVDHEKPHAAGEQRNGETLLEDGHVDGEHNITNSDCGESRRLSFGKKKKSKGQRRNAEKKTHRKKRKRRRRRRTDIGPHTVVGSLNDYFARIQVIPYARYLELRKEYIALRRQSNSQASKLTRKDRRFSEFSSGFCDGKLRRKLESYRDRYWNADVVEEE